MTITLFGPLVYLHATPSSHYVQTVWNGAAFGTDATAPILSKAAPKGDIGCNGRAKRVIENAERSVCRDHTDRMGRQLSPKRIPHPEWGCNPPAGYSTKLLRHQHRLRPITGPQSTHDGTDVKLDGALAEIESVGYALVG